MKKFFWIVFLVVGSLLLFICGFLTGNASLKELQQKNHQLRETNQHLQKRTAYQQISLFFPFYADNKFYLKPIVYQVASSVGDLRRKALELLIAGPKELEGYSPLFPKETRILNLTVADGLATVNLSREATQLNAGSQGEVLVVNALVNTLTKFPDVFRVKILIEGQGVESLAGHLDLTGEFKYSDQFVDSRSVLQVDSEK